MSKAVMISIQPKWCELIASRKKTVEVRKTIPKLEMPFKCYIYESSGNQRAGNENFNVWLKGKGRKKVIGEFVCDEITEFYPTMDLKQLTSIHYQMCVKSCVDMENLYNYANDKILYGYHISDLVIYDEPRELSAFSHTQEYVNKILKSLTHWECGIDDALTKPIKKPPQSWCYVEEISGA